MLLKYILHIVITGSLGVIIYLFARALPRVGDADAMPRETLKTHWLMAYVEKLDERFLSFVEKLLRRSRVVILKLDNTLTRKLHSFKKETPKESAFVELPKEQGENNNIISE